MAIMTLFSNRQPSSSFDRSPRPSGFGPKPSSFPQRTIAQRPPVQRPASISKPAQKPIFSKPASKPQKPVPPKPQIFFGAKKDWKRQDFIDKVARNSLNIGGKGLNFYERKKLLEKTFSPGRFSTYISEKEAKTRLRELRREEYRAKTGADKLKISQTRKYLEKQTGLQGKY